MAARNSSATLVRTRRRAERLDPCERRWGPERRVGLVRARHREHGAVARLERPEHAQPAHGHEVGPRVGIVAQPGALGGVEAARPAFVAAAEQGRQAVEAVLYRSTAPLVAWST